MTCGFMRRSSRVSSLPRKRTNLPTVGMRAHATPVPLGSRRGPPPDEGYGRWSSDQRLPWSGGPGRLRRRRVWAEEEAEPGVGRVCGRLGVERPVLVVVGVGHLDPDGGACGREGGFEVAAVGAAAGVEASGHQVAGEVGALTGRGKACADRRTRFGWILGFHTASTRKPI